MHGDGSDLLLLNAADAAIETDDAFAQTAEKKTPDTAPVKQCM